MCPELGTIVLRYSDLYYAILNSDILLCEHSIGVELNNVGEGDMSIFEMSHWPFSRGILKNTQKLITQKLLKNCSKISQKFLKNYSIFRT